MIAPDNFSENPFQSGARKVIPAVLVYIRHGDQVLMLHRNLEGSGDDHLGKWNGLGGKCELDESPLQAAQREVKEESGLELGLNQFKPLGVLQFPNFKPKKREDWIVFVFQGELQSDPSVSSFQLAHNGMLSSEGELHWVEVAKLDQLNLWPGDRYFLGHVIQSRPFMGTLWYENSQVKQHWITTI